MIRCALLLLLSAATGCYTYRAPQTDIPPGGNVRVILSDSGTTALAALLGPATAQVTGRLVESSPDAYLVAVRETLNRNGREADWSGEQVSIPRSLVSGVEGRYFSRRRTAIGVVALAAVLVIARDVFWGAGGVFGGAPPGGPPPTR